MKKKLFALALAACMTFATAVPAFAANHMVSYTDWSGGWTAEYTVQNSSKMDTTVNWVRPWEWEGESGENIVTLKHCFKGDLNTKVDVSGMWGWGISTLEKRSDGGYLTAKDGPEVTDCLDNHISMDIDTAAVEAYLASDESDHLGEEWKEMLKTELEETGLDYYGSFFELTGSGCMIDPETDEETYYEGVTYHGYDEGSYVGFTKPGIYLIYAETGHTPMEQDESNFMAVIFIEDSADTPAPAPQPKKETAIPKAAAVMIDGEARTMAAYNINGSNYFKLRDVAAAINGTGSSFEVGYDADTKCISLETQKAYTAVGNELGAANAKENKTTTASNQKILLNGEEITMQAYLIDGNNYFQLRELGEQLNFEVTWDDAAKTILIDTAK